MQKKYKILITVFVIIVLATLLLTSQSKKIESNQRELENTVFINEQYFKVDIAKSAADRAQGLSGRKSLKEDEGLLFVFEKEDIYPFWMKNMHFPIDIIWFNKIGQVVHIKEHAQPKDYPKLYTPTTPALYVLEINAGLVEKLNIKLGDTVSLGNN